MRLINRFFILTASMFLSYYLCFAEVTLQPQQYLFEGEVSEDAVNIRSDSTTSSEIICTADKGERLVVLSKMYDWYKVRLPHKAPSFVKKDFVDINKEGRGRILNDFVNIRLRPDMASAILGKVNKGESVNILQGCGEWYRIEPLNNSFGWIHSMFVHKIQDERPNPMPKNKEETLQDNITIEGIIKPKTITGIATHKLISQDNKIYLLRSRTENLEPFNNRKIKLTGKLKNPTAKNPMVEVEKIEVLN